MPKITDTYANAYACCHQVLIETGKFPTIDAIRLRIGVNSPNTINNAIKAWTQDFAEKQLDKQSRPDIPAVLLESIENIWKLAAIEAAKNYAEKENFLKATVADMQNTLDQHQETLRKSKQQIENLETDNEQLLFKIDALMLSIDDITQKNTTYQEQVLALKNHLINKETQLAEQELKWQERQDQDQQWFARRLQEEKDFIERIWQDKNQRQHDTIQSLSLSEESLRQTCLSLSRDHKKVTEELQALQKTVDKKRRGTLKNKRFPKAF